MKLNFASIFVLLVFFMCIGSEKKLQAQNEVEINPVSIKIDDVTQKLNLKLLLTKEQSTLVHKILIENISESTLKDDKEKVLKIINEKIDAALTKKQKTKFEILKSKWLDELFDTSEKK